MGQAKAGDLEKLVEGSRGASQNEAEEASTDVLLREVAQQQARIHELEDLLKDQKRALLLLGRRAASGAAAAGDASNGRSQGTADDCALVEQSSGAEAVAQQARINELEERCKWLQDKLDRRPVVYQEAEPSTDQDLEA